MYTRYSPSFFLMRFRRFALAFGRRQLKDLYHCSLRYRFSSPSGGLLAKGSTGDRNSRTGAFRVLGHQSSHPQCRLLKSIISNVKGPGNQKLFPQRGQHIRGTGRAYKLSRPEKTISIKPAIRTRAAKETHTGGVSCRWVDDYSLYGSGLGEEKE